MFSEQQLNDWKKENVDYSELKELTEIVINPDEPIKQRIENYVEQIGNPYQFLINGKRVKISFDDTNRTLEDCLHNYAMKKNKENITML